MVDIKDGQEDFASSDMAYTSKSNNLIIELSYLKSKEIDRTRTLQNSKSLYGFITPRFSTLEDPNLILEARKTYTVSLPTEVFKKELTKKELKKQGIK